MKYLFLFFSATFYGQVLHHQMLSAQGQSTKTTDGLLITQTIGQQSLTGTAFNKDYIVMQGFQQNYWYKYLNSNTTDTAANIKIETYPNPFTGIINFQFSKPVTDIISISVFDFSGRLMYQQNKNAVNTILTIDLTAFSSSEYLIRLNTTTLNYYTKVIKQ